MELGSDAHPASSSRARSCEVIGTLSEALQMKQREEQEGLFGGTPNIHIHSLRQGNDLRCKGTRGPRQIVCHEVAGEEYVTKQV